MPIEKSFFAFFTELENNNELEWFHANKKRYETTVKEPFMALIEDVVGRTLKLEPELIATPVKNMLYRVNRDIRFAKDKSPYKEYLAATIGPGGTKNKMNPAAYLHLGPKEGYICGGAFWFEDKEVLTNVRRFMMANEKRLNKLLKDKKWLDAFGEMLGTKNKRLPPEFAAATEKLPVLYHTQFYWCANFDPEMALENDFAAFVADKIKAGFPLTQFLREAIYGVKLSG
jgi:uncharacterized protein (TIGR02453 family)